MSNGGSKIYVQYISLLVIHFVNHILHYTLPVLILYIREDFGLNYTQAGFLWSVLIVIMTAGSFLIGLISDSSSKVRYIIIFGGLAVMSLTWFLISVSSTYTHLLLLFALFGLGASGFHPPAMAIMTEMFEQDKGKAISGSMVVGMLGTGVSPFIFATLINFIGDWQSVAITIGAFGVVVGIITMFGTMITGYADERELKNKNNNTFKENMDLRFLATPLILVPLLFISIRSSINKTSNMFTSMLYEDYLSLSKYEASIATAIVIGLSSLLIIVGGAISDKYRPRTSILISSIGVLIGATALVFISDLGDLISFSTFYFILNASYFIGSPATSAMLADRVSPEKRGSVFGALFSFGQVLSVGTPVLFGYINDTHGIIAAFTFILSLAVIALVLGVYIFSDDKKMDLNNQTTY